MNSDANKGGRHPTKGRAVAFSSVVIFALLSGCVSDTLSTQDTQPLAETPSYDPVQRDQAVAEIRQKAAQPGSGQLTNAFADPVSPNQPLSAAEQAERINELEQNAIQNAANVPDAEMAAKQQSIKDLQEKARSHYDNAVDSIQN